MKRSRLDATALAASAAPLALSQLVWFDSAQGSAFGAQIFSWLWLPPVIALISLLLTTRAHALGRVLRGVLAFSNLGWAALILFHEWDKTEFVLKMATQHSGVQVSQIQDLSLAPTVWIAFGALVLSTVVWFTAVLNNSSQDLQQLQAEQRKSAEHVSKDSDPRSIWEEQAS